MAVDFGRKPPGSLGSGDRRKERPDKLSDPLKPKLRKTEVPIPTFGHSGHLAIGLPPNPVRQQKSQEQSGLKPDSPAFKNPQPVQSFQSLPSAPLSKAGSITRPPTVWAASKAAS